MIEDKFKSITLGGERNPNNIAGGWRADADEKKEKQLEKQQENVRKDEVMMARRTRANTGEGKLAEPSSKPEEVSAETDIPVVQETTDAQLEHAKKIENAKETFTFQLNRLEDFMKSLYNRHSSRDNDEKLIIAPTESSSAVQRIRLCKDAIAKAKDSDELVAVLKEFNDYLKQQFDAVLKRTGQISDRYPKLHEALYSDFAAFQVRSNDAKIALTNLVMLTREKS